MRRFILYSAAILLLALSPIPSKAQEIELGAGVVCDTAEQTARFIQLFTTDAQGTADTVNTEFQSPTACMLGVFAFLRGEAGQKVRNQDGEWRITPVYIMAVQMPHGWQAIQPSLFYSAFRTDERGV